MLEEPCLNLRRLHVTCRKGQYWGLFCSLIYINDMPAAVKCKLLLYADDSALLMAGKDINQIEVSLSRELEHIREWLIDNKLSLHLGKTESIVFGTKWRQQK